MVPSWYVGVGGGWVGGSLRATNSLLCLPCRTALFPGARSNVFSCLRARTRFHSAGLQLSTPLLPLRSSPPLPTPSHSRSRAAMRVCSAAYAAACTFISLQPLLTTVTPSSHENKNTPSSSPRSLVRPACLPPTPLSLLFLSQTTFNPLDCPIGPLLFHITVSLAPCFFGGLARAYTSLAAATLTF